MRWTDKQAAKRAANACAKKLGDLGAFGVALDDLTQIALIGIWRGADISAKLDGPVRGAAMVNAGKRAIVDYMRHEHGRSPAARDAKRAIRVEAPEDHEASDHWANDPQRMVEAMETWESVAKLPVRLQMLATLLGVGYESKDIAAFIGVDPSRVCQLRGQLGNLLEAMA